MLMLCLNPRSSALANPADLVKGTLVSEYLKPHNSTDGTYFSSYAAYYPQGRPYHNTPHAFAAIWREGVQGTSSRSPLRGGLSALYRGVDATTVRGIILSSSQICSYDQVKQVLKRRGIMEEGLGLHLTASLFAG